MAIRGPSPSPTLQLLASRAFSSTIPLARHATARVARVVNRPSPVGRCYNRPVVRPNHGGLTAPNRPRNVPSSGPGRPKAHSGSQRKYSTQGADGTYYSTGGTSYGYVPPESYTMSDILFSTFLKGRRAQGKGREGKKKKKQSEHSPGGTAKDRSRSNERTHSQGSARANARLDSEDWHSTNLAHVGFCDGRCRVYHGTLAMIDTTLSSDETWRQHRNSLLVLTSKRPSVGRSNDSGLQQQQQQQQQRDFHSSSPRQGLPFLVQAAALLKSSGALSFVQLVGRIALTLLPMAVLKRSLFLKLIKHLPLSEHPTLAGMHKHMQASINFINIVMWGLIVVPGSLFVATFLASLERTPVTGRWRLILLSPEEEKSVADDLRGDGWRDAVANILTMGETEPLPRVIPLSDWRTQWVLQTWRHLESVVPLLQANSEAVQEAFERRALASVSDPETNSSLPQAGDFPFPPPSKYALMPRPRATTFLHAVTPCITDKMEAENVAALSRDDITHHGARVSPPYSTSNDPPAHALLGPPYSLLVVEKPGSANAFSYGFGPDGGGGVVVYSGFLDEILRRTDPALMGNPASEPATPPSSGWSLLSLFTGSQPSMAPKEYTIPTSYQPTPEQTTYLAILLAHELAHLILSHHLETLSSNSILVPTVVSMFADLARTLAFPFTMIFGPFVNDALWEASKLGTGEVVKSSEACRVKGLEVEADLVGARLLAYAGWDARSAIRFWEERQAAEMCADKPVKKSAPSPASDPNVSQASPSTGVWKSVQEWWARRAGGMEKAGTWFTKSTEGSGHMGGHPISLERVRKLRMELEKWEAEREQYLKKARQAQQVQQVQQAQQAVAHS